MQSDNDVEATSKYQQSVVARWTNHLVECMYKFTVALTTEYHGQAFNLIKCFAWNLAFVKIFRPIYCLCQTPGFYQCDIFCVCARLLVFTLFCLCSFFSNKLYIIKRNIRDYIHICNSGGRYSSRPSSRSCSCPTSRHSSSARSPQTRAPWLPSRTTCTALYCSPNSTDEIGGTKCHSNRSIPPASLQ